MRWGVTVLTVALLIAFVWVSGCDNLFLGKTQVADFGTSKDAQNVKEWFEGKYGDPAKYSGPPRIVEVMISDGITTDNLPTDKLEKMSKNTKSVYVWGAYEGFNKGDKVTATWVYNGKDYAQLSKNTRGNYGLIWGQFDMPESGWVTGTHTITLSGNKAQGPVTFDIIDGAPVTAPLPFKAAQTDQRTAVQTPVTSGCTHDVYVYNGVDYGKSTPLTSIRVNVFGEKTLESGYNVPDDWVTSAYTDASGYAKLTIPDSAFSKYQYFVVLPEIPAKYERAGVQTATGTTSVQGSCPHTGPVTLFVNLDPYTKTTLCGGKSEFWFAQKTDDILNQCSVTGSLSKSQLSWGDALVVQGSSKTCTSPVIIFKLAKGAVSTAPPADAFNIGSAVKNTNNEYIFTWDTGQGKQTFGLTDGQYTVFAINPTNNKYVSLPVTIGPNTGPTSGCTISATAVRFALGIGRTTPEIPKLGWGDYVQISGTMTNCAVPVSLKIKGPNLPAQGVELKPSNDDISYYPINQNGPFSMRWGTYQLGGKYWNDYPTTRAVYSGTFIDKNGNEYSPIQLDFTNPPACMISGTMDAQASIDPAIKEFSWTHPVTLRGLEDYCTAGLKFKLQKKSDLLSHPGDSSWIYDHGMDIGTVAPSSEGFTFIWKPLIAQQQYQLADGDYVIFIMNAAGTEYTKYGFFIGTNPGGNVPATTTPVTITPTTVTPSPGNCYHRVYAYDGMKGDTTKGLANVPTQIYGSNNPGSYNVANRIDGGTTFADGHIDLTIPASARSTWNYFFVSCAGVSPTNGYRNAGARSYTGTTSTPVSLGFEMINPYTPQNVCGGTSDYWFTRAAP